jgi:hypothetical protein
VEEAEEEKEEEEEEEEDEKAWVGPPPGRQPRRKLAPRKILGWLHRPLRFQLFRRQRGRERGRNRSG